MPDNLQKVIYPIPAVASGGFSDINGEESGLSSSPLFGGGGSPRTAPFECEKAIASILMELAAKDNLDRATKKWFSEKFNEMRTQSKNNILLDAIIHDDEFFYKLLFIGGAGITVLGAALMIAVPTDIGDKALGQDIAFGGLVLIAGGLTVTVFAAMMLAIPRVFGADGIQFEADGGISVTGGASGSLKIG